LKRDYTLPEIIFSIIAVIFVGVFTVRMYIQAENMQNKARDLDMASLAAQSAVEAFKAEYSPPEWAAANNTGAQASRPQSPENADSMPALPAKPKGFAITSKTVYFDKDFRAVPENDEKGFVLTMDIEDGGMGLFDVKADVVKAAPYFGDTETHVFSLTTSIYKGIGR
jgi:hypothetical protein